MDAPLGVNQNPLVTRGTGERRMSRNDNEREKAILGESFSFYVDC